MKYYSCRNSSPGYLLVQVRFSAKLFAIDVENVCNLKLVPLGIEVLPCIGISKKVSSQGVMYMYMYNNYAYYYGLIMTLQMFPQHLYFSLFSFLPSFHFSG